jgi:hypothetical protein
MDWSQPQSSLQASCGTSRVVLEEIYPWLVASGWLDFPNADPKALSGTLAMDSLFVNGPADRPSDWRFELIGSARNFEIDTIPQKKTARRMIEMVAAINQTNFAGVQSVTCWTCHRQQERPATSIALDHLYEAPNVEDPDIAFPGVGKLTATQVLDNYIQAAGGAQRLAGLTSFVATGASIGYGDFGGDAEFTLYSKAPNQRTTIKTLAIL